MTATAQPNGFGNRMPPYEILSALENDRPQLTISSERPDRRARDEQVRIA